MRIREATAEDVDRLVEMGCAFLEASAYAGRIRKNPAQMAALIEQLIGMETGAVLVAERHAEPVGMIGLIVYPHSISGDLTGAELFWWVNPEARGRTGIALLRAAERWAKDRGAQQMLMIAPNKDVEQLYAALQYTPLEVTYERTL